MLAAVVATVGCINLGKPKVVGPQGQTIAKGHYLEKTTGAVLQQTKRKSTELVSKIKRAMPGQPHVKLVDKVIGKNDPTRLDNMPANVGPELYIAGARLAERNGRYDQALEQYSLALKKDGQNRNALIGMGRLQHRAGNMEAAIRIYRDALNTYRDDAVIMNDLGLCYAKNGQLNEAISVLQAATRTAPDRTLYLNNLAACLVEANHLGDAYAQLSRVHGAAKANFNVGYLLNQAGKQSEAEKYLSQALALDPGMHQARTLLDQIAPQVSSLPPSVSSSRTHQLPDSWRSEQLRAPAKFNRSPEKIPATEPKAVVPR